MIEKDDLKEQYMKKDVVDLNFVSKITHNNELAQLERELFQSKHKYKEKEKSREDELQKQLDEAIEIERKKLIKKLEKEKLIELKKQREIIIKQERDRFQNQQSNKVLEVKSISKKVVPKLTNLLEAKDKEKEKTNIKIVSKIDNSKIDKKRFNYIGCYTMKNNSYNTPKECFENIPKFLDENKDSKLFEIIGVVNKNELNKIKQLQKDNSKHNINRLNKLIEVGLSKKRAIEGVWLIKAHLGTSRNTQITNYIVKSNRNQKGFIIRAYK
jgi:hypothetical protein